MDDMNTPVAKPKTGLIVGLILLSAIIFTSAGFYLGAYLKSDSTTDNKKYGCFKDGRCVDPPLSYFSASPVASTKHSASPSAAASFATGHILVSFNVGDDAATIKSIIESHGLTVGDNFAAGSSEYGSSVKVIVPVGTEVANVSKLKQDSRIRIVELDYLASTQ